MKIRLEIWIFVAALLCAVPSVARAQSTITGTVKDASGAVLPGVTVEISSPVLIEKVRSVATDENGGYRVTDLRPGLYTITFTLPGFATVKRDQILNREALDAIPTGRTIQAMGQLITGVSLNQPDIGGSKAMQQTYMSAHGAGSSQTTVQVDGLMMNGIDVDGAVQNYFNSSMSQEMVYTRTI